MSSLKGPLGTKKSVLEIEMFSHIKICVKIGDLTHMAIESIEEY